MDSANECFSGCATVMPRLTSDPANELTLLTNFSASEDIFSLFLDSANEYGFG